MYILNISRSSQPIKIGIDLSWIIAEMPTSGDLKSGDSLFFTAHPPGNSINHRSPPHPPQRWELIRTLYEVLHKVHTIKIRVLMPEIIFVND